MTGDTKYADPLPACIEYSTTIRITNVFSMLLKFNTLSQQRSHTLQTNNHNYNSDCEIHLVRPAWDRFYFSLLEENTFDSVAFRRRKAVRRSASFESLSESVSSSAPIASLKVGCGKMEIHQ